MILPSTHVETVRSDRDSASLPQYIFPDGPDYGARVSSRRSLRQRMVGAGCSTAVRRCGSQSVMLRTQRQSGLRRSYESNSVVDLGSRVPSQIITQAESVVCRPIASKMCRFSPSAIESAGFTA